MLLTVLIEGERDGTEVAAAAVGAVSVAVGAAAAAAAAVGTMSAGCGPNESLRENEAVDASRGLEEAAGGRNSDEADEDGGRDMTSSRGGRPGD